MNKQFLKNNLKKWLSKRKDPFEYPYLTFRGVNINELDKIELMKLAEHLADKLDKAEKRCFSSPRL